MAEYSAGRRSPERQPTHPGALLRDDILVALDLSVTEAAEKLGISRQMLHGILNERHTVTPEMAAFNQAGKRFKVNAGSSETIQAQAQPPSQ